MAAISVVIRTHNSDKVIRDCLNSLARQSTGDFEIIVVDGGSIDRTLNIVKEFQTRLLRDTPGINPCNVGIQAATGSIVAFVDDDCTVPEDWVKGIFLGFEDRRVGAVGGPEVAPPMSKYWARCFEAIRELEKSFLLQWGPIEQLCTCNIAYRKAALEEVGGFADSLFAGEETELNWRLFNKGWKLEFVSGLGVFHNRRSSLRRYFAQQIITGLGAGRMLRMHPRFFKPSHLGMAVLVWIFMILLWLLVSGRPETAAALIVSFMIIASLTAVYGGFRSKEKRLIPGIIVALVSLVVARCLGFLLGLLKPSQHSTRRGS